MWKMQNYGKKIKNYICIRNANMEPVRRDKSSVIQIESNWGKLIEVKNFNITISNLKRAIWGWSVKNDAWKWNIRIFRNNCGMLKNTYFTEHPWVTPSGNEITIYLLPIVVNGTSKINILNILLSRETDSKGFSNILFFQLLLILSNIKINFFGCEIYVETDFYFLKCSLENRSSLENQQKIFIQASIFNGAILK